MKIKETDLKYSELFGKFEKYFKNQGFFPRDNFDGKIFFLAEDNAFQVYCKAFKKELMQTPQARNPMFDILAELNQCEDPRDFPNLKINVERFIYKLCNCLLDAHKIIARSEITIRETNIHKKINYINENLKLLNERIEKNPTPSSSKLNLSIVRVENLIQGEFQIELRLNELFIKTTSDISLNSTEKSDNISQITSQNQIQNTMRNVYLTNYENSVLKLSQNRDTQNIIFKKNEIPVFEEIELNFLSFPEFKVDDSSTYISNLNKQHQKFSGCNISTFKIKCTTYNKNNKKKRIELESKTEFFLDLMLMFVEDIYDISRCEIKKTLHIKLLPNISSLKNEEEEEFTLIMEMSLNLDDHTRVSILNRLLELYHGVIETRRLNEDYIDDIVENYFPEISNTIKATIYNTFEEKRENCCGCLLF
jgi:hypothetical protein